MIRAMRVGILVSHPIQYYSVWFRHLARRHEVEVFYCHRQAPRDQARAGFGVEFDWDVPLLDGYSHRFLVNMARHPRVDSFFGCDCPEIYEVVGRGKFDAFLVVGWNRRASWQAIRACRAAGVPVLMRGDSQLETPRSRLRTAAKHVPYRTFLPRLDAHLYVGLRNRSYLERYGVPPERLFFAPHFVDNAFFRSGAERARREGRAEAARAAAGIPVSATVLLFVGKLVPGKRPLDLVEALQLQGQEAREVWAMVVGDGELRGELERVCRDGPGERIRFLGFRNQRSMPELYAAADILVLPSESETWGLVVNEAMGCGLPAIVSDAAGCAPDLIDEGATGFTYPAGDVRALGERIADLSDRLRREPERIRTAIRAKVERYSVEIATAGLEAAMDATRKRQRE